MLLKEEALIPLNDLGLLRSYSIFDFFRVLSGVPVFLEDHLDRLLGSVDKMELDLRWSKDEIRTMCREIIASNEVVDAGLRIVVTGGYSHDGYTPARANIYMMMHNLPEYSPDDFTQGRKMISSNFTRDLPEAKTTLYVHAIHHQKRMKEVNAIEILYHTDGVITEGSRANMFFVDQNDVIVTPADAILRGITRRHLMHVAKDKYNIVERTMVMDEIADMKEAFLTSSTKGVLPVIEIGGVVIGDGKVGAITSDLHQLFNAHVAEYITAHREEFDDS